MRVVVCAALLSAGCGERASLTSPSALSSFAARATADAGLSPPALAGGAAATVPFKGTLSGAYGASSGTFPIIHESIAASGNATHLGQYTLVMEETVNFLDATATGTFTFTAANGDTLSGRYTGQARPGPIVSIVEHATITDGTGRFEGAAGAFVIEREFDPSNGTTAGAFDGSMSSVGSNQH
jgi:hypothetical protein